MTQHQGSAPKGISRRQALRALGGAAAVAALSGAEAAALPASQAASGEAGSRQQTHSPLAKRAPAVLQGNAALKGEITHWGWAGSLDALKNATPLFNETYPNIKVNYVESTVNDIRDRLLASLVSGVGAPDSSGMTDRFIPLLFESGGIVDLTDRVSEMRDQFAPYKWSAYTDEAGLIYGIPWDSAPMATYYRHDLFAEAELPTDHQQLSSEIATWDDYIELGKQLIANSDRKMLALSTNQSINRLSSDDLVEGMLIQHEAHMFDENGRLRDPNPRAVEVLALLKRMVDAGITVDVGRDDKVPWTNALKEGQFVSEPNAVWAMAFIRPAAPETEGNWRVFQLPAVAQGGKRSSLNGGSGVVITSQAKDFDVTWAFAEFMMTNPRALAVGWQKNSIFPAYLPAFDEPEFTEPDPLFGGQNAAQLFAEVLPEVPPMVYTAMYLDAHAAALNATTEVLRGDKSPEQAWAEAIERVKQLM